jgi:hypothetical protein
MTIPEFLERLCVSGQDWTAMSGDDGPRGGPIRGRLLTAWGVACCPITAVADSGDLGKAIGVGQALGLSEDDAKRIVQAADGWRNYDAPLRRQLLEAVGLGETR